MFQIPVTRCPLVQDVCFDLLLLLLATAIGCRFLRSIKAPVQSLSSLERGVFSSAIGFGLLQYGPMLLGGIGQLNAKSIWLLLIGLLVVFLFDMIRVIIGCLRAVRRFRRSAAPTIVSVGSLVLIAFACLELFPAVCPPTDEDGLSYHLTAPRYWLTDGHLSYLPTLAHTNAPMGVEMLFCLPMAVWSDTAAKLIHYIFGILVWISIYCLGRRLLSPAVGIVAALGFASCIPGTLGLMTNAYIDLGMTFEIVCAFLAWLFWQRQREDRWLTTAALCLGFAASFKLTGLIYGMVFTVITFLPLRADTTPAAVRLRRSILFGILSFIPVLPWLFRTWRVTGNPVWPFLTAIFPSIDWSRQGERAFQAWFRYYNWGGSARLAALTLRQREILLVVAEIAVITVTVILWRLIKQQDRRNMMLALGMLAFMTISATGLYMRFFLPVMAVGLCLLISCLAGAGRAKQAGWVCLLLLMSVQLAREIKNEIKSLPDAVSTAIGHTTRHDYLERHLELAHLWDFCNTHIAAGKPILVAGFHPAFGTTGGATYYSSHVCFVTDAYLQERFRLGKWTDFAFDVKRNGIHYAIVPDNATPHANYGPDFPAIKNELPFAMELARRCGTKLMSDRSVSVYRIDIPDVLPEPRHAFLPTRSRRVKL